MASESSDPPESEIRRAPGLPEAPSVPRWAAVALPEHQAPSTGGSGPDQGPSSDGPVTPGGPDGAPATTAEEAVAASLRSSASSVSSSDRPTTRRTVQSIGTLYTFVGVGALALGLAFATRSAPDWAEGRWWLLEAGLLAVAILTSAMSVFVAVSALGEIHRHRTLFRGTLAAAGGLLLGGAVLVGSGTLAGNDWTELDVPAAWDRLELGSTDPEPVKASGSTLGFEELRLEADWGACYPGDPARPGRVVDCADGHRTEVVGSFTLPRPSAGEAYPGLEALAAISQPRCQEQIDNKAAGVAHPGEARALVPPEQFWRAGDTKVTCVVTFAEPQTAPLGATG